MSSIMVQGGLLELRAKLMRIQAVINYRVHYGYVPFQHDEEWQYITAEDVRVCAELCAPLHGNVYRGDYVPSLFQFSVSVNAEVVAVNQHKYCRCQLHWVNKREVLVQRLFEELLGAAA